MIRLGAVVAGLLLSTLPFLMYGVGVHTHASAPHTDHEPRHGGQLRMVGDYHLERVERRRAVEVYLSDASRRPLRPAWGRIVRDDGSEIPLAWSRHRLVASGRSDSLGGLYEVAVPNGPVLSVRFP